jgi:hypothetical protein
MCITDYGSTHQNKDAGPDNRSNSECRQIPRSQRFFEPVLWLVGIGQNLIDGFCSKKGIAHGCPQAHDARL